MFKIYNFLEAPVAIPQDDTVNWIEINNNQIGA